VTSHHQDPIIGAAFSFSLINQSKRLVKNIMKQYLNGCNVDEKRQWLELSARS